MTAPRFSPGCCCVIDVCYFYSTTAQGNIADAEPPMPGITIIAGEWVLDNPAAPNGTTVATSLTGTPVHAIIDGKDWDDSFSEGDCVYGIVYSVSFTSGGFPDDFMVVLCIDPGDGTGTRDAFMILKDSGDMSILAIEFDFDAGGVVGVYAERYLHNSVLSWEIVRDFLHRQWIPPEPDGDPSCAEFGGSDGSLVELVSTDDYTLQPAGGHIDNSRGYNYRDNVRSIPYTPTEGNPVSIGIWAKKLDDSPFALALESVIIRRWAMPTTMIGTNAYALWSAAEAVCYFGAVGDDDCFKVANTWWECAALVHTPWQVVVDFGAGGWTGWSGDNCQGGTWAADSDACEKIVGEKAMIGVHHNGLFGGGTGGLRGDNICTGNLPTIAPDPPQPANCDAVAPGFVSAHSITRSTVNESKHCLFVGSPGGLGLGFNSVMYLTNFRVDGADYIAEVVVWVWRQASGGDPANRAYDGFSVVRYRKTQAEPFLFDSLDVLTLPKIDENHYKTFYVQPTGGGPEGTDPLCVCYYLCDGTLPESVTVRPIHD